MAGFFYKGILLQQMKEPALSRDLREFVNADTVGLYLDGSPVKNPEDLTHGEIINVARSANIIDERDGRALADKLLQSRRLLPNLLIADAIDDEPYISSQLNPILKNQQLAADGLTLCQRACGATTAMFAVYRNLTDLDVRIPKHIGSFVVERIHGRYPAEYQASKAYAENSGVLMIGAGAILHLARAVLFSRPQTTTFITVAGNCIGNPTNLEVSLGMTVSQVLERCGLIDEPNRVVVGGSMTGISVIDTDNTLVTPTTRAILAFRQDIKSQNFQCIGCSRCVHACPEGLNPFFLHRGVNLHRYDMIGRYDAQMCVGCGTCSYMCPAKLDLADMISKSSETFRPMFDSMERAKKEQKDYENSSYQNYFADFKLAKAISAHKRALRHLKSNYFKSVSEAERTYTRAGREADQLLNEAEKTLHIQEATANQLLSTALSTMQASENSADSTLKMALNTLNASEKAADKSLSEAVDTMTAKGREADTAVECARNSIDMADTESQRAGQEAEKTLDQAGRESERAINIALKAKEAAERQADKFFASSEKEANLVQSRSIREAEKELHEIEKNSQSYTPDALEAARQKCGQIYASAAQLLRETCAQARAGCETQKQNAKAEYERIVRECGDAQKKARELIPESREVGKLAKVQAQNEYSKKQELAVEIKEEAKKAYEKAQIDCDTAKSRARDIYAQAEIICESSKEQARKIYSQAEIVCETSKSESALQFSVRQGEIEEMRTKSLLDREETLRHLIHEAIEIRSEIDRTLRKMRTQALVMAKSAAEAKATLSRRSPCLDDFIVPAHIIKSEKELICPPIVFPDEICERKDQSKKNESASGEYSNKRTERNAFGLNADSEVVHEVHELLKGWSKTVVPQKRRKGGRTI